MLKDAKGYKWGRKSLIRLAKTAITKAGSNSYAHRRQKKREARKLWQVRINAFLDGQGISYSVFMNNLKKSGIELDRKVLADLAANDPQIMQAIVDKTKMSASEEVQK
jgi:large subunit ribosomal protein L20